MSGEPVITVVGNLTADPELRFIGDGTPVANFTIASTPRTFNRQNNSWDDGETIFFRCSVWRDYAENVADSLHKGMQVICTGKLTVRGFTDNSGAQRTSIELKVDEIGPSLRFARANIEKVSRGSGSNYGSGSYGQSYGGGQGSWSNSSATAGEVWEGSSSSQFDNPPGF